MAKTKPTGAQPDENGQPTYDMVMQLLYTFNHSSTYNRHDPDTYSNEYAAALAAVAAREKELEGDKLLLQLKAKAAATRAADEKHAKHLHDRAGAIRRVLLAEGLTDRVRRLVGSLVEDSHKR